MPVEVVTTPVLLSPRRRCSAAQDRRTPSSTGNCVARARRSVCSLTIASSCSAPTADREPMAVENPRVVSAIAESRGKVMHHTCPRALASNVHTLVDALPPMGRRLHVIDAEPITYEVVLETTDALS